MDQNMLGGFPILSIMVYLPVLTAVVLLFVKYNERSDDATKKKNGDVIRWIALGGAAIDLVISVVALALYMSKYFNSGIAQADSFDFQEHFAWLPDLNITYHLGADALSLLLLVLTTLLMVISILVSWAPIKSRVREFYIVLLLLQAGMMGVFVALDFFRLLHLLGSNARSDGPFDRHLGVVKQSIRSHQVLPLHPRRLSLDAGGHYRPLPQLQPPNTGHTGSTAPGTGHGPRPAKLGVPGLRRRVRRQGSHVPVPHLVARRPRGSPRPRALSSLRASSSRWAHTASSGLPSPSRLPVHQPSPPSWSACR